MFILINRIKYYLTILFIGIVFLVNPASAADKMKTSIDQVLYSEIVGQNVLYAYHGDTIYNNEYNGISEDFSKREANKEYYFDGKNGFIKIYFSNFYDPDTVDYQLLWATTTIEIFEQANDNEVITKNFFIKTALADTDLTFCTCADTTLIKGSNSNYGHLTETSIFKHTTEDDQQNEILRITIPTISDTSAEINGAVLNYWQSGFYNNCSIELHELTQTSWEEFEATWNEYDDGLNWAVAGGDYSSAVIDKINITTGDKLLTWTIQGDNAINPLALNFGDTIDLILFASSTETDKRGIDVFTSEDLTNPPYVIISYSVDTVVATSSIEREWIDGINTIEIRGTIGDNIVDLIVNIPFFLFLLVAIVLFAGFFIIIILKKNVD